MWLMFPSCAAILQHTDRTCPTNSFLISRVFLKGSKCIDFFLFWSHENSIWDLIVDGSVRAQSITAAGGVALQRNWRCPQVDKWIHHHNVHQMNLLFAAGALWKGWLIAGDSELHLFPISSESCLYYIQSYLLKQFQKNEKRGNKQCEWVTPWITLNVKHLMEFTLKLFLFVFLPLWTPGVWEL